MSVSRDNKPTRSPLQGADLRNAILHFRDQHRSVLIASSDRDGCPDASYAPYLVDAQQRPLIFVSRLATHTNNLLDSGQASLLFIADESQSPNLFARQRLIYQCNVAEVLSGSDEHRLLLNDMVKYLGPIIKTLRQLPDFHLLRLTPTHGRYIEGFGKAYSWQGALPDDKPCHVNPGNISSRARS